MSHKPVAVAAGLRQVGIHRNVIHPKFGNFMLLGNVLIGAEATAYDQPIAYNPCLVVVSSTLVWPCFMARSKKTATNVEIPY